MDGLLRMQHVGEVPPRLMRLLKIPSTVLSHIDIHNGELGCPVHNPSRSRACLDCSKNRILLALVATNSQQSLVLHRSTRMAASQEIRVGRRFILR